MNHPVGLGRELLVSNWKRKKEEGRTEGRREEMREGGGEGRREGESSVGGRMRLRGVGVPLWPKSYRSSSFYAIISGMK